MTALYVWHSENEKGGRRMPWIENHDIDTWHKTQSRRSARCACRITRPLRS